jgi:competence protein ComEC
VAHFGLLRRGSAGLTQIIDGQRGHLFPWAPVFMAFGIGIYFRLPVDPSQQHWILLASALVGLGLIWAAWARHNVALIAVWLVLAGIALAGVRSTLVADPVLGYRYYGAIEGRVVQIDRSLSDRTRLTLDQVRMDRVSPGRTPGRVRISLHSTQDFAPEAGDIIGTTGHLSPPQGPAEPGGFDFQRHAWFRGLGAVGYTRVPVVRLARAEAGAGLWVYRLRLQISAAIQSRLPGDVGAFAAAVTTGDRSAMRRDTLDALRASNLAHLLAISGLHMGLLTGFVLGALRLGLAAIPPLALRWPVRKIAALGALVAGACYLAMSGGNVATERAFIMAAVVLTAVLLDRRALTLRAVALAAMIVLLLRPEALTEPGFQMSFAATTALIAVFGSLRGRGPARMPRLLRPVMAVVISSAVAGAATAPFGAAHFNQISHFGLIANVLSVPLMGIAVVPGAVVAALLWPFGAAGVGLALMQPAIAWILGVAGTVAARPDAVSQIASPVGWVLPVVALGGITIVLWQGRARWVGALVMIAGFAAWANDERPLALIAGDGSIVGAMTAQGRALSKPRGGGFVARSWLENDGDDADQGLAALRSAPMEGGIWSHSVGGIALTHLSGKAGVAMASETCRAGSILVVATQVQNPDPDCLLLDLNQLRLTGSIAVFSDKKNELHLVTACDLQGARAWSRCRDAPDGVSLRTLGSAAEPPDTVE